MKEFSKSNLLSRAIEIRPKNELVGHLSELSLGPLLFLLFVNDLPEGIRSILKLFVDDVKMIEDPNNFSNIALDFRTLGGTVVFEV